MDNNLDQELEKYIFDPANPSGFKAYNLLLNILRERKNAAYISPTFMLEIFHKEIFDEELKKKMWDVPEGFEELSGLDRINAYTRNYSILDLYNEADRRLKETTYKTHKLFNAYIKYKDNVIYNRVNIGWSNGIGVGRELDSINVAYLSIQSILSKKAQIVESDILGYNIIMFLHDEEIEVLGEIRPSATSIVISTVDSFHKKKQLLNFPHGNFKPILLKKIEDIHPLLNFLIRDLETQTAKVNPSIQTTTPSFLSDISIENYFTLKNIELEKLENRKEIYFLGENGQGKTLLLQAIALGMKGNENVGAVIDFTKQNPESKTLKLTAKDAQGKTYHYSAHADKQKDSFSNLLAYGINRLAFDSEKKEAEGYLSLFTPHAKLEDPIEWLKYLDHKQARNETDGIDLDTAKEFLKEIVDQEISIEVNAEGVTFYERGSRLSFSQLSDGFKSVMIWLGDMIVRLSKSQPEAKILRDLTGVVLIDEIDLLLHPKWQKTIVGKLRRWFPNVQFIITTHSPIVVLGASKDAVFYKMYKEGGETKISEPYPNENLSNLMANSILTSPLFDMETARMSAFTPDDEELETNPDYLSVKIHKQIKEKLQKEKANGKAYFSEDEIDAMIAEALK